MVLIPARMQRTLVRKCRTYFKGHFAAKINHAGVARQDVYIHYASRLSRGYSNCCVLEIVLVPTVQWPVQWPSGRDSGVKKISHMWRKRNSWEQLSTTTVWKQGAHLRSWHIKRRYWEAIHLEHLWNLLLWAVCFSVNYFSERSKLVILYSKTKPDIQCAWIWQQLRLIYEWI